MVIEIIFDTYDNISLVSFKQGIIPIDFSDATKFILIIGDITIDSSIDPTAIEFTAIEGELKFDIGDQSVPIGSHNATLIWFDASHPNGQILTCSDDEELIFQVKICN